LGNEAVIPVVLRFCRTLDRFTFAAKHPRPHVIVGHYNPLEQIDEEATGEPSYFGVLVSAQKALALAGDCTGLVDMGTATIKLSYALAEDAAWVRALVYAVPDWPAGDCASTAFFNYDRELYDRLRVICDGRTGTIGAAFGRQEERQQVIGTAEPFDHIDGRRASPVDDDWGCKGSLVRVSARYPLQQP
jgi:hypothetical protein